MTRALIALPVFLIAACAGMGADECRSANWYELGFRDAIFGIRPQDATYATQCERVDLAQYSQGWREGNWEFERRKASSGAD
jgi:hypothetical protein